MSSNKYSGGLTALLNRERERKTEPQQSADSAPSANPAPSANCTPPPVQNLHGAESAPSARIAPLQPVSRGAESAPSAKSAPSHVIFVEPRDGYTAIPNTILDGLAARLSSTELSVYLRLYRLSHGFKREECSVGYNTLARSCNISRRTAIDTVARLEDAGLIARDAVKATKTGADQGNRYRVFLPRVLDADSAPHAKSARGEKPAPGADSAPNKKKDLKENIKSEISKPSVYDVRTIAARIREAHVGDASFGDAALKAAVRTALLGAGRDADDATIDEATKGMVAP